MKRFVNNSRPFFGNQFVNGFPSKSFFQWSARSIKYAIDDNSSSSVLKLLKAVFFCNSTGSLNRARVPKEGLHNTQIEGL